MRSSRPYVQLDPAVIEQARQMDLLSYLRAYEPNNLVRVGGSVYCTREHDSLKISNGKWYWWSRGIGGVSALDYLIKVKDYGFVEAVEALTGGAVEWTPPQTPKKDEPKVLLLPPKHRDCNRVMQYLFGRGIRNEDATHIMYLVTKSLKYNRDKIINNLTAVIQSIIAMDTTGTDVLKLQEQIKKVEGKRANLIDLYMSNLINKDEFTATRASCDAEIEELQSIIESVDKQREMIEQQQQLLKEIEDAIKEIVSGVEYEDEFYKHILDKMVVQDKDNIDVYLNLLPMKWSYTVAKASKKAVASEWNISEASLPISVKRPLSSGYGML